MERSRLWKSSAALLATVTAGWIVSFGVLDNRPVLLGAEAADLAFLVRSHDWARLGPSAPTSLGALLQFKPPLYYVGVPLALGGVDALSLASLLAVNAAALLVACWAGWRVGVRLAGPAAGAAVVAVFCLLPGVVGRFTFVGVEPMHTALLALFLAGLVEWRCGGPRWQWTALVGVAGGLGMLAKWNFVAPMLGPALLVPSWLRTRKDWAHAFAAAGLAAALFAAWAVSHLDLGALASTAGLEKEREWFDAVRQLGLWWGRRAMGGPAGLAATAVAVAGLLRRPAGASDRLPLLLVLSSAASLLAVHALIPHKEIRYLVPVLFPAAVLLGAGLTSVAQASRAGTAVALLSLVGLAWTTWVEFPAFARDGDPSSAFNHALKLHRPSEASMAELTPIVPCARPEARAAAAMLPAGQPASPLLNTLGWWLHANGPTRLIWSSDRETVDSLSSERLATFDLMVVNRDVELAERAALERGGFALSSTVHWPVGNGEQVHFWCRR
jgi:hypothetical protein